MGRSTASRAFPFLLGAGLAAITAGCGQAESPARHLVTDETIEPGTCGVVRRTRIPDLDSWEDASFARSRGGFDLNPTRHFLDTKASVIHWGHIDASGEDQRIFGASSERLTTGWGWGGPTLDRIVVIFGTVLDDSTRIYDSAFLDAGADEVTDGSNVLVTPPPIPVWGTTSVETVTALDGTRGLFTIGPAQQSEIHAVLVDDQGEPFGEPLVLETSSRRIRACKSLRWNTPLPSPIAMPANLRFVTSSSRRTA